MLLVVDDEMAQTNPKESPQLAVSLGFLKRLQLEILNGECSRGIELYRVIEDDHSLKLKAGETVWAVDGELFGTSGKSVRDFQNLTIKPRKQWSIEDVSNFVTFLPAEEEGLEVGCNEKTNSANLFHLIAPSAVQFLEIVEALEAHFQDRLVFILVDHTASSKNNKDTHATRLIYIRSWLDSSLLGLVHQALSTIREIDEMVEVVLSPYEQEKLEKDLAKDESFEERIEEMINFLGSPSDLGVQYLRLAFEMWLTSRKRHDQISVLNLKHFEGESPYLITALEHTERAEYLHAIQHYQAYIDLHITSDEAKRKQSVAKAIQSIAAIYLEMGNFDAALEQYNLSFAVLLDEGDSEENSNLIVSLRLGVADVLEAMGNHEDSSLLLDEILEVQEKQFGSGSLQVAVVNQKRASVLKEKGNFDDALHLYQKILEVHKSNESELIVDTRQKLGELYLSKQDYNTAFEHLSAALLMKRNLLDCPGHPGLASLEIGIATSLKKQGDLEGAMKYCIAATESLAMQKNLPPRYVTQLHKLGELQESLSIFSEAEKSHSRGRDLHEKYFGPISKKVDNSLVYLYTHYTLRGKAVLEQLLENRCQELGVEHPECESIRLHLNSLSTGTLFRKPQFRKEDASPRQKSERDEGNAATLQETERPVHVQGLPSRFNDLSGPNSPQRVPFRTRARYLPLVVPTERREVDFNEVEELRTFRDERRRRADVRRQERRQRQETDFERLRFEERELRGLRPWIEELAPLDRSNRDENAELDLWWPKFYRKRWETWRRISPDAFKSPAENVEHEEEPGEFFLQRDNHISISSDPYDSAYLQLMLENLKGRDPLKSQIGISKRVAVERARLFKRASVLSDPPVEDRRWLQQLGVPEIIGPSLLVLIRRGVYLEGIRATDFQEAMGFLSDENVVIGWDGARKVLTSFALEGEMTHETFLDQCAAICTLASDHIACIEGVFVDEELNRGYIVNPYYNNLDALISNPEQMSNSDLCFRIAGDVVIAMVELRTRIRVHGKLSIGCVYITHDHRAVLGRFDELLKQGEICEDGLAAEDVEFLCGISNMLISDHQISSHLESVRRNERPRLETLLRIKQIILDNDSPNLARICGICTENEAITHCSSKAHGYCRECVNNWIDSGNILSVWPDGSLRCCFECITVVSSNSLASLLTTENWNKILLAVLNREELDYQHHIDEQRRNRQPPESGPELVTYHIKRISEEIMTPRCPDCHQAFIDYEGCSSLTCSSSEGGPFGCGAKFCALCLEPSDSNFSHSCPNGRLTFKSAMKLRRSEALLAYWTTLIAPLTESIRFDIVDSLVDFVSLLDVHVLDSIFLN